MEDGRIKSVKYYVRFNSDPVLAIKLYKTGTKYHRFIAIISNNNEYTIKEIKKNLYTKKIKCLLSPKKGVSNYLNEYGDKWITTGKCELSQNFSENVTDIIKKFLLFNYGCNKAVINYQPKRYESDVKLFDWEFRMFHKPEDN